MNPLELQNKVRYNAMEQQSSIKELLKWEKDAQKKDELMKRKVKRIKKVKNSSLTSTNIPIRASGGLIPIKGLNKKENLTDNKISKKIQNEQELISDKTAGDHTYDKYFKY